MTTKILDDEQLRRLNWTFPTQKYEVSGDMHGMDVTREVNEPENSARRVYLNWKIIDTSTGATIVALAGGASHAFAVFLCNQLNSSVGHEAIFPKGGREHYVANREMVKMLTYLNEAYPKILEYRDIPNEPFLGSEILKILSNPKIANSDRGHVKMLFFKAETFMEEYDRVQKIKERYAEEN